MITCEDFTYEQWRKRIAEMAEKAFAEHRITKETENRWKCGKPGTSVFQFRIQFGPGSIHLYGDIQDMILHPYGGDAKDWLIGVLHPDRADLEISNSEYIMEKAPLTLKETQQVFLLREAKAQIESDREEARECEDDSWLEQIDKFEALFLEALTITSEQRGMCGESVAWCESFFEAYQDAEGMDNPYDWNGQVLHQLHALRVFVKLYLESPWK